MNPRLLLTTLMVMLLSQGVLLAVSPLVVDDADTTEPGYFQLSPDFSFARQGSMWVYLTPVNLVTGINAHIELGMIFGYQWQTVPVPCQRQPMPTEFPILRSSRRCGFGKGLITNSNLPRDWI